MVDVTITIPNEHVERVREAFEFNRVGSPVPTVTIADVQKFLVAKLKEYVKEAEYMKAVRAAEEAQTEVDIFSV